VSALLVPFSVAEPAFVEGEAGWVGDGIVDENVVGEGMGDPLTRCC